jgi:iron complex outermembrane recepter protein
LDKRRVSTETERTSLLEEEGGGFYESLLDQNMKGVNRNQNHNIRLGSDYYFTEKTILSAEVSGSLRRGDNDETLKTLIQNGQSDSRLTEQRTLSDQLSNNLEYNLSFKHEFKKPKQEISAVFLQNYSQDNGEANLTIESSDVGLERQRNSKNDNRNVNTNFQLDYAHPIGKKGMFETGYKLSVRDLNTDSDFENFVLDRWIYDGILSNEFEYQEQVHAGYVAYKNSLGKWDYSLGIRAEQVQMEGEVQSLQTNDGFSKDFLNFFPSVRLAYNLDETQFIKISYNKRISRPNFNDLNPFVDISNPLNLRAGNPDINPELSHTFELGYNKTWEKYTLSPTLFYRHQSNVVQRIIGLVNDSVSLSRPENVGFLRNYGIELSASARFTKNWDVNASYTFAQNEVVADESNAGVSSSVNNWNARFNSNLVIVSDLRFSVMAFYNSARAIAQGTFLPVYMMGLGLQKPILKKKGSIGLNVRDLFYSMRFGTETKGENFEQKSSTRRDTRVVMANFRYRF